MDFKGKNEVENMVSHNGSRPSDLQILRILFQTPNRRLRAEEIAIYLGLPYTPQSVAVELGYMVNAGDLSRTGAGYGLTRQGLMYTSGLRN